MPEGDTIFKLAEAIRPLLEGALLIRADARDRAKVAGLPGRRATKVEAIGKHLLFSFDDETILRTHLGMKGSWHRYARDERWRKGLDAMGVLLVTETDELVCFYPKVVDRFPARERPVHPVLSRLGPDLLKDPFELDEVIARARSRAPPDAAALLLDQEIASGAGNIYKCETLFLERVHPEAPFSALSDDDLRRLFARARTLMRANLGPGPRNTTGRDRPALWIYDARTCPRCRGKVEVTALGDEARLTWWCPRCQPLR